MTRKFFVGGNFKMNGSIESIKKIVAGLNNAELDPNVEVVVAPPSLYLLSVRESLRPEVAVSAQNIYTKASGAFTGEISAVQLKDAGIPWTIVGHSERRTLFGDHDELVAQKTKAALDAGVKVILCVGETLQERESDKTIEVVERQLAAVLKEVTDWSNIVIAYEPVWAIGTGKVATTEQAQEVHHNLRGWLAKQISQTVADNTRIIYGGSVAGANCVDLSRQGDIDGFLVGGASLKPEFIDIINSKRPKAKH
jgi:triosephosphate isomerase